MLESFRRWHDSSKTGKTKVILKNWKHQAREWERSMRKRLFMHWHTKTIRWLVRRRLACYAKCQSAIFNQRRARDRLGLLLLLVSFWSDRRRLQIERVLVRGGSTEGNAGAGIKRRISKEYISTACRGNSWNINTNKPRKHAGTPDRTDGHGLLSSSATSNLKRSAARVNKLRIRRVFSNVLLKDLFQCLELTRSKSQLTCTKRRWFRTAASTKRRWAKQAVGGCHCRFSTKQRASGCGGFRCKQTSVCCCNVTSISWISNEIHTEQHCLH